jgi:hypothetical protein
MGLAEKLDWKGLKVNIAGTCYEILKEVLINVHIIPCKKQVLMAYPLLHVNNKKL